MNINIRAEEMSQIYSRNELEQMKEEALQNALNTSDGPYKRRCLERAELANQALIFLKG